HVPYAKVPRLGLRTTKGRLITAWIGTLLVLAITVPRYYFFSALFVYIVWGLVKTVSLGLLDRLPDRDPLLDEPDDDDDYDHSRDTRTLDYSHLNPEPRRAAPPPPENDT
ncbi:MAG: hypothetical protein HKN71_04460, partial [Gemmatimonadetes bacterium]|nr:hypothetical protein [Gemmatimonadota bacterium]